MAQTRGEFVTTRRAFLAACLLVGATGFAMAEVDNAVIETIGQRVVDAPVLRGAVEQRKTVKGFRNPLVSRGNFLVARELGVVWHTLQPFESTLVVTRDRLISHQSDGSVGTLIDAHDEPGLRMVNELLFALIRADLAVLTARFYIEGSLQRGDVWQLTLTPRDEMLAQWLTRAELEGDDHVRIVRLDEVRGDSTLIRFGEQQVGDVPTASETARFD